MAHHLTRRPITRQQPPGVGPPGLQVGLWTVHHVSPVDRQLHVTDPLGGLRPGLAVLARDPTHPHHRLMRDHLQDTGEHVEQSRLASHLTRGALRGVLCTVPRLYHMRLPGSDSSEHRPEPAQRSDLHQRGTGRQHVPDARNQRHVLPLRLLQSRHLRRFEQNDVHSFSSFRY